MAQIGAALDGQRGRPAGDRRHGAAVRRLPHQGRGGAAALLAGRRACRRAGPGLRPVLGRDGRARHLRGRPPVLGRVRRTARAACRRRCARSSSRSAWSPRCSERGCASCSATSSACWPSRRSATSGMFAVRSWPCSRGQALAGVAVYVVGHGLTKAALFMCAGVLLHRFATIDEYDAARPRPRGTDRRRPVGRGRPAARRRAAVHHLHRASRCSRQLPPRTPATAGSSPSSCVVSALDRRSCAARRRSRVPGLGIRTRAPAQEQAGGARGRMTRPGASATTPRC